MGEVSPALFTVNNSGNGQITAINEDGTVSGLANPAKPGTVVSLYGTGQGRVAGAPPDGYLVTDAVSTDEKPRVFINNAVVAEEDVLFSGLAPDSVGIWRIDVRIPENTPAGNAVRVAIQFKGLLSSDPQNPGLRPPTLVIRP
jgi:uncharacterized protein (TIGR03437 family)